MPAPPFHLLTEPQRECLRLAARGFTSKQIGERLGKSHYTIDDRFERAVALLGAADRKEAVRWFAEHEAGETPERIGPDPPAIADSLPNAMLPPSPTGAEQEPIADGVREQRHAFDPTLPAPTDLPLPFRRSQRNDLTFKQRLLLIPLIALGIMLAAGAFMGGLDALSRLFEGQLLKH